MKVLTNQKTITPSFADYVTYLFDALPSFWERAIPQLPKSGFVEGLAAFLLSKRFDVTLTVGFDAAFAFALASRLLGSQGRQVVKELYFDESSLAPRFKRDVVRWAFAKVALVITNCSGETRFLAKLLRLPLERFQFMAWATAIPSRVDPMAGEYVFAAGRSFRDWDTLFAAVRGTGLRTVVVAAKGDIRETPPAEVELHIDLTYEEYLRLLERASVVVLPLAPTVRSVSQMVLLDAMAYGKPVIATRVSGVTDYVIPGETALLYEPGDDKELRELILRCTVTPPYGNS